MSSFSFFWHDYETFGAVPRRDRPAQFAGLRTDADLNQIGEPVMLYCRPAPDSLPEPEACLLTGILPQTCQELGVPEMEFSRRIETELARPGTVGVGYNSIRFDDEVTRHLFWRTLTDPYAREYKNECGRWDVMDVVRCMYALRPDGLNWPRHPDGRVSFKLEDLSAANGLAHESAHDALSDVHATLGLARLVKAAQPRLWEFCLKLRHKQAVLEEIRPNRPFLHVSGMYPAERGCIALVWPLAPHPSNKNELIVWDLSEDPTELTRLNAEDLRRRIFSRNEDLPEGERRLPVKTIHINKSPVVIGNLRTLSPAQAERWGLDVTAALAHAEYAESAGAAVAGLWEDVFRRPPTGAPVDVDEDLYSGFLNPTDRQRLDRLRHLPPTDAAWKRASFDDPRLAEIVFRARARSFPESLDAAETQRWQSHCAARLHKGQGGVLTLSTLFERLDALGEALMSGAEEGPQQQAAAERGEAILSALYEWAEQVAPPLA